MCGPNGRCTTNAEAGLCGTYWYDIGQYQQRELNAELCANVVSTRAVVVSSQAARDGDDNDSEVDGALSVCIPLSSRLFSLSLPPSVSVYIYIYIYITSLSVYI